MKDQLDRLKDVLPAVCRVGEETDVLVSIDTTLAAVARFAIDAGASIINDVSAGRDDSEMFRLAADRDAGLILMHMLGSPGTMQDNPVYDDVLVEVKQFLHDRVNAAVDAGVQRGRCIIDPGIGFGKTLEDNIRLLSSVDDLCTLGCPVLIGPSRKRFIGTLASVDNPTDRTGGTIGACLACYQKGASIFRVHDVAQLRQAFVVSRTIG